MIFKTFRATAQLLAALGVGLAVTVLAARPAFATNIFTENPLPTFAGQTDNAMGGT
jgi:hypothetical protein